ncbi:MAG: primosomal protein N', partial [Clostridia bacterium]|nr:primosomal protein N' [Clostridia bacterium]
ARLSDDFDPDRPRTQKQKAVTDLLAEVGAASIKEIGYFTGVTSAVVSALEKKGDLVTFDEEVYRTDVVEEAADPAPITLTPEQQEAFDGLLALTKENKGQTALLYGVTGSGKTQVFLRLVDEVVAEGRGAIVMVPEIALTPQTLSLFRRRYGGRVAAFHSAMSLGRRLDEWKRVRDGQALVAVGTRSAVFAPFRDLGLILMDEEQEHTYKSESSPRYHARDVARFRAAWHKCLLVPASATPSVETFSLAKSGRCALFTLRERYGGARLPQVHTVDMRQEMREGNVSPFSRTLIMRLGETLEAGCQAILLLNRRGHHTVVTCAACGHVMTCPHCSISLTYHSDNNRLMCHTCGYSAPFVSKCPECGAAQIKYAGVGTQRAERELKEQFPEARVLRMDADSTMARRAYEEKLTAFAKGEYDILLGTQMIEMGLDFPRVTLVGVLGADGALYSEDYHSFERTFSLLTQVIGRSGRGDDEGLAVVQSLSPDNEIIELAARQDYDAFYEQEILTRKVMIYPPY